MARAAPLLAAAMLVACTATSAGGGGVTGRPGALRGADDLAAVRCWAPAFGGADPAAISRYDLAVVDAVADRSGDRDTSAQDLAALHDAGVVVLAYLSVGTAEDWRHYASSVDSSWTLDPVDGWPGERYVDARVDAWRWLMAAEARELEALGFDGFYLDNLDVAELYPETADAVVALVEGLRDAAPRALLVAQNGLAVAERLPIDGIAHEDVFWRWDEGYRASPAAETRRLLAGLRRLRDQGVPVFTLDYTEPGSSAAPEVVRRSVAEGFRPAVSVIDLDAPPHAPACAG